jgi:hypothetical protein
LRGGIGKRAVEPEHDAWLEASRPAAVQDDGSIGADRGLGERQRLVRRGERAADGDLPQHAETTWISMSNLI